MQFLRSSVFKVRPPGFPGGFRLRRRPLPIGAVADSETGCGLLAIGAKQNRPAAADRLAVFAETIRLVLPYYRDSPRLVDFGPERTWPGWWSRGDSNS